MILDDVSRIPSRKPENIPENLQGTEKGVFIVNESENNTVILRRNQLISLAHVWHLC